MKERKRGGFPPLCWSPKAAAHSRRGEAEGARGRGGEQEEKEEKEEERAQQEREEES